MAMCELRSIGEGKTGGGEHASRKTLGKLGAKWQVSALVSGINWRKFYGF